VSNVAGIQANVSYNTNHLEVDCAINAYWVAMNTYVSPFTNCNGPAAQVGWLRQNSGGSILTSLFTYTQQATDAHGCGFMAMPSGTLATQTYRASTENITLGCGSGSNGTVFYYAAGSEVDARCVDWLSVDQVEAQSERQGSTNHMSAISYKSAVYCTSSTGGMCSPGTALGGSTSSGDSEVYIGHVGVTAPDFNTCDVLDFTSSTC
jgi:hypothetical protein